MTHYRPLPSSLTIKQSEINGLGLFADEDILKDTLLGITHVMHEDYEDGLIRTPLGGFFNHSEEPNVKLKSINQTMVMITSRDIKSGEEITGTYSIYDPTK